MHFCNEVMVKSNMQRLKSLIENVCKVLSDFISHLDSQKMRNESNKSKNTDDAEENSIESYTVIKVKLSSSTQYWESKLNNLCTTINTTACYHPIEINKCSKYSNRKELYKTIQHIKSGGLSIQRIFDYYYFKIPSVGPNMAVNFIWKQPKDEEGKEEGKQNICVLHHNLDHM